MTATIRFFTILTVSLAFTLGIVNSAIAQAADPFDLSFQVKDSGKKTPSDPFDLAFKYKADTDGKPQVLPHDPLLPELQFPDNTNKSPKWLQGSVSQDIPERVTLSVKVEPKQVRPGEVVQLTIEGKVVEKWHTYPITVKLKTQIGLLSRIKYKHEDEFQVLWPITESKPDAHGEGSLRELVQHGTYTWKQDIYVKPDATPGEKTVNLAVYMQVCEDSGSCLPPGYYPPLKATFTVTDAAAVQPSNELKKRLQVTIAPEPKVVTEDQLARNGQKGQTNTSDDDNTDDSTMLPTSFLGLAVGAFLGGIFMLLTPCVFPLMPITVNFFIKQSEKGNYNPLMMACVYSGTIVVVMLAAVLGLLALFEELNRYTWFNLALGALLIFFGLSLFGLYEIELPSFLSNFTASKEDQGGYLGAVFMALTFSITSFSCTGPFLALLVSSVGTTGVPMWQKLIAGTIYSVTFAAPFFVLALFPPLLKAMPKSGGWLNTVKVTMGFIELGAAFKFLANADIYLNPGNPMFFNYDTTVCAWIGLSIACGLYLIGTFRLPHDSPTEHIGVVRMLFAVFFLGLAVYMLPLLYGTKPAGVVGDGMKSFLPPSFRTTQVAGGGNGETGSNEHLSWHLDYEKAWKEAVAQNKLIFIDFTGVNCPNCRYNEENVFPKTEVKSLLKKYVRVQLYTDQVPVPGKGAAEAQKNQKWQKALNNNNTAMPTYIILRPDVDEPFKDGLINGIKLGSRGGVQDPARFARFLQRPLEPGATQTAKR